MIIYIYIHMYIEITSSDSNHAFILYIYEHIQSCPKIEFPKMIYATVHSYNSIQANRLKDFSLDQAGYAISLVHSLSSPPTHQSPKSSARSFLASACKRHRESSTQQLFSCVAVGWLVLSFFDVSSKVLLYKTVL